MTLIPKPITHIPKPTAHLPPPTAPPLPTAFRRMSTRPTANLHSWHRCGHSRCGMGTVSSYDISQAMWRTTRQRLLQRRQSSRRPAALALHTGLSLRSMYTMQPIARDLTALNCTYLRLPHLPALSCPYRRLGGWIRTRTKWISGGLRSSRAAASASSQPSSLPNSQHQGTPSRPR